MAEIGDKTIEKIVADVKYLALAYPGDADRGREHKGAQEADEGDRVMEQMYDELDGFTEKDWPDDVRTCASDALTLDGVRIRKVKK